MTTMLNGLSDYDRAEGARKHLADAGRAASNEDWPTAIAYTGTAHGLMCGTPAVQPLHSLLGAFVSRATHGESAVSLDWLNAAYNSAERAIGTVLTDLA